jgi:tungstate transport system permease protein
MLDAILGATLRSLAVSAIATLLAALLGIPLGTYLGMRKMHGRRFLKSLIYTFYGFPPVVAGLLIYLLLSSAGPLGFMHLLFTLPAMILAEFLLAFPLVLGITMMSVSAIRTEVRDAIRVLGVSRGQEVILYLREAKNGILAGVMVGFGSAISEVGAAMMVGGGIEGETNVLTTDIMVHTRMGNFEYAIVLAVILLALCFAIYFVLARLEDAGDE